MQLAIEKYDGTRYSASAEKIYEGLQNRAANKLDLLIREAVQNSLDAARKGAQIVQMKFLSGNFTRNAFWTKILENEEQHLTDDAKSRYTDTSGDECADFLAVRDLNTHGLTGDSNDSESRLNKLVFGFMNGKKDEEQNKGGSYGVGKTIFMQLGIGFVIYYSRPYEGKSNLTISYCVPKANDIFQPGYIPKYAAWWGVSDEQNFAVIGGERRARIRPLEDENEIKTILDVFGLQPYGDNETGTMIIVPFLRNDLLPKVDGQEEMGRMQLPDWTNNLSAYLEYCIMKWYFPRLAIMGKKDDFDNPLEPFTKKPALAYSFNNHVISKESCQFRFFSWLRRIYDAAVMKLQAEDFSDPEIPTCKIDLQRWAEQRERDCNTLGVFAYHIFTKEETTNISPYYAPDVIALTEREKDTRNFLLYCRAPGMIISYNDIKWDEALKDANLQDGEYIFGIFVVNSENRIYSGREAKAQNHLLMTLDQYFRKTEPGDHFCWDANAKIAGLALSKNIISKISEKIRERFAVPEQEGAETPDQQLSAFFGRLFQPLSGQTGGTASPRKKAMDGNNGEGKTSRSGKGRKTSMTYDEPSFRKADDAILVFVPVSLRFTDKCREIQVELAVASDGKPESMDAENPAAFPLSFVAEQISVVNPFAESSELSVEAKKNMLIFRLADGSKTFDWKVSICYRSPDQKISGILRKNEK